LDVGSEDDEDSETDLKLAQTKTLRSKDKKVVELLKKDEETKINLAKIVHAESKTYFLNKKMLKVKNSATIFSHLIVSYFVEVYNFKFKKNYSCLKF
jgi:hypothetical protein